MIGVEATLTCVARVRLSPKAHAAKKITSRCLTCGIIGGAEGMEREL